MLCVAIFSFVIVMRSIAIMKGGGAFVIYIALKHVNFILAIFFLKVFM